MKKLSELLIEGVTLNDVMEASLDGLDMVGDFKLTNKAGVALENLRVKYLLAGVPFKQIMADASKTTVIRQQRPARELSEKELTRLFSRDNPMVRHYSEAGLKIETPEQLEAKRTAAINSMSKEEREDMIKKLTASLK